jgi:hypothetical protein
MATDRDEQERQQQELEEIRRSFAEMGARMGSLFEPAGPDQDGQPALPAPPAPPAAPARGRRWWVVALALFLAGGVFGYLLPRGETGTSASAQPRPAATATTASTAAPTTAPPRTRTGVPEVCLEAAEKGDEVIALLIGNIRNRRLSSALDEYTVASQACQREASP